MGQAEGAVSESAFVLRVPLRLTALRVLSIRARTTERTSFEALGSAIRHKALAHPAHRRMSPPEGLSDAQAAVYDRQLRLWGHEVQRRSAAQCTEDDCQRERQIEGAQRRIKQRALLSSTQADGRQGPYPRRRRPSSRGEQGSRSGSAPDHSTAHCWRAPLREPTDRASQRRHHRPTCTCACWA